MGEIKRELFKGGGLVYVYVPLSTLLRSLSSFQVPTLRLADKRAAGLSIPAGCSRDASKASQNSAGYV